MKSYNLKNFFNPAPSYVMHIDFNSCFASIEQQANPLLRGKPVAVAAYTSPGGCILTASREAKKIGIKVGMRVKDGKKICPSLIILSPDPSKYRSVHLSLKKIISSYTEDFSPKSIDEFVINMKNILAVKNIKSEMVSDKMKEIAKEIKYKIKSEIGDWLTVSIGISTNRYLAKVAAGLKKPDGLEEINANNYKEVFSNLSLTDLTGIKEANASRLRSRGIYTVTDLFNSTYYDLKAAFRAITSYYWYLRIHGFEVDDVEFTRKSFGNSFALPKPLISLSETAPILTKLCEKASFRLRKAGCKAKGIHVWILYRDWSMWHTGLSFPESFFDSREAYKKAAGIFALSSQEKEIREISVTLFNIVKNPSLQLNLFKDVVKEKKLAQSLDDINDRWGNFVISSARLLFMEKDMMPERIAFGGIKELESSLP